MDNIYEKLSDYCESDAYPFHMPGHKRRLGQMCDPFRIDITEIDGFDNLHHAEDLLLHAQQRAAALAGAEETFYLVNGSTCGLLTAVSAAAEVMGKKAHAQTSSDIKCGILMARNCHKAAYHAVYLNRLAPTYLWPEDFDKSGAYSFINGRITPQMVSEALKKDPMLKIVLITSPTYDGVVSDVKGIAQAAHDHGAILIVDEAHGAHFGLSEYTPQSAVTLGADLVIQSIHKTLPALTQTALLHRCSDRVPGALLRRYLGIYQTSSPSYVLMASMDQCIRTMHTEGKELLKQLYTNLDLFYAQIRHLKYLRVLKMDDPSKIIIDTEHAGLSGNAICDMLRNKFRLEMEMSAPSYVLAFAAVGDTKEGFDRLKEALFTIDQRIGEGSISVEESQTVDASAAYRNKPVIKHLIHEAWALEDESLPLSLCCGRISSEFVFLYPPGIPLLVPGEQADETMIQTLTDLKAAGYSLQGIADHTGMSLRVIND